MNSIPVTINGEVREVPAGTTLEALLAQMNIEPDSIATALNGEFVPRARRDTQILERGDVVTCFRPIVGG